MMMMTMMLLMTDDDDEHARCRFPRLIMFNFVFVRCIYALHVYRWASIAQPQCLGSRFDSVKTARSDIPRFTFTLRVCVRLCLRHLRGSGAEVTHT